MCEQSEHDDITIGNGVLGKVRFADELKELLPEYPFPYALRGIYDDIWGTTPVPGEPTVIKYPHRRYPPSLKKKAGLTYGLLSSLFAQRDSLRELLRVKCQCGNEYVVPKKLYPNPFSDCGCCIEYLLDKSGQAESSKVECGK